jgi:hypothetical protein
MRRSAKIFAQLLLPARKAIVVALGRKKPGALLLCRVENTGLVSAKTTLRRVEQQPARKWSAVVTLSVAEHIRTLELASVSINVSRCLLFNDLSASARQKVAASIQEHAELRAG